MLERHIVGMGSVQPWMMKCWAGHNTLDVHSLTLSEHAIPPTHTKYETDIAHNTRLPTSLRSVPVADVSLLSVGSWNGLATSSPRLAGR